MNFLQFFVWGSWLISLGGYMGRELHFEGGQIGAIFATMGIASLVMPGIIGIIADKWFNAERLYGLCHIAGAGCLFYASTATGYDQMYWAMRSEEHTSELQSQHLISYAVFCLKKKFF